MDKHYIIKQDIVNLLTKHDDSFSLDVLPIKKMMAFSQIHYHLKQYTKLELLDYLQELSDLEYLYCSKEIDESKFIIKGKGRNAFHQNQFILDGKKNELEVTQIQSVIDTNANVKKSNFRIYILTGALVLVAVIGLIKELVKDKHMQEKEQLLQKQMTRLDSIQQIHQTDLNNLKKVSPVKDTILLKSQIYKK